MPVLQRLSAILVAALVVCVLSATAVAQHVEADPNFSDPARAWSLACMNEAAIQNACHAAVAADQVLFIVARPGNGDVHPQLSWRRLEKIRCYISSQVTKQPALLLAVGEPVDGVGRVDFYVAGAPVPHGDGVARVYARRNGFFRLFETETPSAAQLRCQGL